MSEEFKNVMQYVLAGTVLAYILLFIVLLFKIV